MAISDNMRAIRREKGLTQKQVADACGLAVTTFRTYELGNANPKPATVAKLAKALGVSPSVLYGVDWVPGIEIPDQEAASALYQSFFIDKGGALSFEATSKGRLLAVFDKLNESGQQEAIKRLDEMAISSQYQKAQQSTLAKVLLQYITSKNKTSYAIVDEQETEMEFVGNRLTVRHIVMDEFPLGQERQQHFWYYPFIADQFDESKIRDLMEEIVDYHDSEERSFQDWVIFSDKVCLSAADAVLSQRYIDCDPETETHRPILYIKVTNTGEISVWDELHASDYYVGPPVPTTW